MLLLVNLFYSILKMLAANYDELIVLKIIDTYCPV